MPRTALPTRPPAAAPVRPTGARRPAARAVAGVLLLGLVVTAGAPSSIRIRRGDTLSEIAQRAGTSVGVLQRLNSLASAARIYAGDTLRLPGSSSRSRSTSRTVERGYTVRSGDTLTGIARRYGVTVATIRTRNRLSTAAPLQIGRRLAIPVRVSRDASSGGATAPTSSAGVRTYVSASAARHRAQLRSMAVPSRAAVRRMVASTARQHGVSPSLALAVSYQESGFQQRVVSGVDAIGVMQVLPSTARVLSRQHGRTLDLLRTQDNVTAGVLLLRQLLRTTGSEPAALAGYYQGLGSIARQGVLPQTHAYIRSVGALRPRFAQG